MKIFQLILNVHHCFEKKFMTHLFEKQASLLELTHPVIVPNRSNDLNSIVFKTAVPLPAYPSDELRYTYMAVLLNVPQMGVNPRRLMVQHFFVTYAPDYVSQPSHVYIWNAMHCRYYAIKSMRLRTSPISASSLSSTRQQHIHHTLTLILYETKTRARGQ